MDVKEPLPSSTKCPQCGKASTPDAHPFCSKNCAYVDLGVWLRGGYHIPGSTALEDEE